MRLFYKETSGVYLIKKISELPVNSCLHLLCLGRRFIATGSIYATENRRQHCLEVLFVKFSKLTQIFMQAHIDLSTALLIFYKEKIVLVMNAFALFFTSVLFSSIMFIAVFLLKSHLFIFVN